MNNTFFGIVEDIDDPRQLGRVRVRVFGVHSPSVADIKTEDLPWAPVLTPTTSSSNSGIGTTPRILCGSLVMLTFLDEDKQHPFIMGTVPSEIKEYFINFDGSDVKRGNDNFGFQDPDNVYPTSEYVNENDLPKLSRSVDNEFVRTQHTSTNELFDITEPEDIRSNHQYPHNQVRQSTTGHYEEWDDTPGNERINTQHKSGTFEEIRPDGTKVTKIVNEQFEIVTSNDTVWIGGNCNVHIEGNNNIYVKQNQNLTIDENQNTVIHKSQNITIDESRTTNIGQNESLTIGQNRTTDVGQNETVTIGGNSDVNISGSSNITVGSTTNLKSGSSVTIDTPSTTITGTLQVTGSQTNSSTITASGEVTGNGIKLSTHKHTGVTSGPSTTGTPI